jgi:hypothetical protein
MSRMIVLFIVIVVVLLTAVAYYSARQMPGRSCRGPDTCLTGADQLLLERLQGHVCTLAETVGERHLWRFANLEAAASYIDTSLTEIGYEVTAQEYVVEGKWVRNLQAEIAGAAAAEEIVLIGAHYDSVPGSPGANDNASGVAVLLEMARLLANARPARTIRFVAFVNEEPPLFKSRYMGSRVYARQSRQQQEAIAAMISLETIGYYTCDQNSQAFPFFPLRFFYPTTGDFVAFVSNFASRHLLFQSLAAFRRQAAIPSEGLVAPGWLVGVDWSDHWAFWKEGYPAIMVTDTALFRYPYYHSHQDTPEKLDYAGLTKVALGLTQMVAELAGSRQPLAAGSGSSKGLENPPGS